MFGVKKMPGTNKLICNSNYFSSVASFRFSFFLYKAAMTQDDAVNGTMECEMKFIRSPASLPFVWRKIDTM